MSASIFQAGCLLMVAIPALVMAQGGSAEIDRLLRRAQERLDRKDYKGALLDADAVIKSAPKDARGWVKRGDIYFSQNEFAKAIVDFDEAKRLDPQAEIKNLPPCYSKAGDQLANHGKYGEAKKYYSRALELDAKNLAAVWGMGISLQEPDELAGAADYFLKGAELSPKDGAYAFELGRLYGRLNEWEKSISAYQKSIDLKHNVDSSHFDTAFALRHLGRYEESIAMSAKGGTGSFNLLNRGYGYLKLKKTAEAKAEFDKFAKTANGTSDYVEMTRALATRTEKEPKTADEYFERGLERRRVGDIGGGDGDFDRALRLDAKHVPTWRERGRSAFNDGRSAFAIFCYDKVIPITSSPNSGVYQDFYERGTSLGRVGRLDEALRDLNRSLQIKPGDLNALWERGLVFRVMGNLPEAVADFDAVLVGNPTFARTVRERAIALVRMGKRADADKDIALYRTLEPKLAKELDNAILSAAPYLPPKSTPLSKENARLQKASRLCDRGKFAEAQAEVEALIKDSPELAQAYSMRACIRMAQLEPGIADALEDVKKARDFDPKIEIVFEANIWDRIGAFHLTRGDLGKAEPFLAKATELRPWETSTLQDLALVRVFVKTPEDAIPLLDKLLRLAPNSAMGLEWRGRIHHLAGRHAEASKDMMRRNQFVKADGWSYGDLGIVLAGLEKNDEAIEILREIPERFPAELVAIRQAYLWWGICELRRGKKDEATQAFRRCMGPYVGLSKQTVDLARKYADERPAEPKTGEDCIELCKAASMLHNDDMRLGYALRAIKLAPESANAFVELGGYGFLRGYDWLALYGYGKAIELDDRHPVAFNLRGQVYLDKKLYQAALADYNQAVEVRGLANDYYKRGETYYWLKKAEQGLPDLNEAISKEAGNANMYLLRAKMYSDLKQNEPAVADFSRALELSPNLHEARRQRGMSLLRQGKKADAQKDFDIYIERLPHQKTSLDAEIKAAQDSPPVKSPQ